MPRLQVHSAACLCWSLQDQNLFVMAGSSLLKSTSEVLERQKLQFASGKRACSLVRPKASRPARKHILAACSMQPCTSFSSGLVPDAFGVGDTGMLRCSSTNSCQRRPRDSSKISCLVHGFSCASVQHDWLQQCSEPAIIPQTTGCVR